jgi:hypothetical protein
MTNIEFELLVQAGHYILVAMLLAAPLMISA